MAHCVVRSRRRIDAICSGFEASWRAGQRPQIEALVAAAEPDDRTQLLAELIALEFELRLESGEPAQLSEYQDRFAVDEPAVVEAASRINSADAVAAARSPRERFESIVDAQRLQLGEPLGAGGMGEVVRARDLWLKRNLAVKILADRLQTHRPAVERFIREARVCGWLQHPGIIPVYEMGWLGERPYFAMQAVTGQSLADLLAARRHPEDGLSHWLEVFERVCETVAYAHDQGVVHRDLKPANVMLGSFGEVYVIDWGLAKWLPGERPQLGPRPEGEGADDRFPAGPFPEADAAEEAPLPEGEANGSAGSLLGVVAGSPGYMPPEQAKGLTESTDRRSDVFALGSVLCEILTGAPPYADDDDRTRLERARQGDTAEALARLDGCSADRELVVLARDCLAIDPAARPADASHVWQRVKTFLRGVQEKLQKIELERAEARARAQERRRRRRIVLSLAACLVFLLGLFGTAGAWFAQREAARRRDDAVRREQIQQQLAETLDEIDQLYAEAPEDWRADPLRRTRIRELARRAETLAESPWFERTAVQRVEQLRARIEAEDADGRLLDRLEAIRLESAKVNPRTGKLATGRTRPLYRYAFNNYGLDLDKVDAPSAVAKIRSRPAHVVEACVFGLGSWRLLFKSSTVPQSQWIDAVLDGIDGDPWRRAVRQSCREQDWNAVGELLQTARGKNLSVDAINFVAMDLMHAQQFDLAIELLQAAQPKHPGDFWINQFLGVAFYSLPDDRFEEAVRFTTAALAIRETETGYLILGLALSELRRDAEAEQAFRAALRLQPDYVQARLSLADVLERQGRTDDAAVLREEAAQLQQPGQGKASSDQ